MPKCGELLLIPFPFTDYSSAKRRPVLALTNSDAYGDFIALPVTSRPQHDHSLAINPGDLIEGVLPAPSWIRINRIVTLNENLVVKRVGRLTTDAVAAAIDCFCAYITQASSAVSKD